MRELPARIVAGFVFTVGTIVYAAMWAAILTCFGAAYSLWSEFRYAWQWVHGISSNPIHWLCAGIVLVLLVGTITFVGVSIVTDQDDNA